MKHIELLVPAILSVVAIGGAIAFATTCSSPTPAPRASARESASAAPAPASAPPVARSEPAPPPPASAGAPSATPIEVVIEAGDWKRLIGRWVDAEKGDAIPGGPTGGKIVDAGARVDIVKGRPGSKTPWNLSFWGPREGHRDARSISGGCGFYESGLAFCRGYGMAKSKSAMQTSVRFLESGPDRVHIVVEDLFDAQAIRP